jgi:hypothetical protein
MMIVDAIDVAATGMVRKTSREARTRLERPRGRRRFRRVCVRVPRAKSAGDARARRLEKIARALTRTMS